MEATPPRVSRPTTALYFYYFGAIYDGALSIYDGLHLLIHADDATVIASNRRSAINKLKTMLDYCSVNYIIPQFSKCEFVVVNGLEDDCKPLPFGGSDLKMVNNTTVLGSHLSCATSLKEELSLHMKNRYITISLI